MADELWRRQTLAPYATLPWQSRGRLHREAEAPSRSPFQRDRDRIIHSTAFRRLKHKTQVFVYHEGDHYRTRLTHSLEVAQIARSICRTLRLDEDLGEAVALAHDLGHTPFGHAGEEALHAAMAPYGGFDHNAQTLRILTKLEERYAEFNGANNIGQNSLGIVNALTTAPFAAEVNAAGRAFVAAGTFLDDVQVDFLIEATQADRRNISLQSPRLTTTNGQQANIYIANQLTYISGLTPITNQSAVAFQPQTAPLNTGVQMLVRGTISADRRYVTTDIYTQISQLVRFRTGQTFAAVAGGGGVGGGGGSAVIPSGNFQLPEVQISSVQTTVSIPDQGTILLGGQRIVTEQEVESGVPVLSKIPILNRFFSNRTESKSEQTLLILYKPTILIQSEQENKAHPGLIDSLNAGLGG